MATPFSFEIVTPDKMLFASEEVTYVGFRALSGNLGLKARHMPIIATMDIAPMKLEFTDGSVKEFAVCGGFLEMKDNNAPFWQLLPKLMQILIPLVQPQLKNVQSNVLLPRAKTLTLFVPKTR